MTSTLQIQVGSRLKRRHLLRKLLVLTLVAVGAVALPTAASVAQPADQDECSSSVVVEGRCLSVDGRPSLCNGQACVVFVEESVDVCPTAATAVTTTPLVCQLTESAMQRDDDCPDGARGEVDGCYIYLAMGPDGCIALAFLDAAGNCRREAANATGSYFCERAGAQLLGRDCTSTVDSFPSPCPSGTTRFDGACWRMNGLTPPESCGGHQVAGTTELPSGQCEVPLAIPTGPTSCIQPAVYREHPSYILIDQSGQPQGEGPVEAACVDDSASVGLAVRHCFYTDDEFNWGNVGDPGLCTRFELPVTTTCPADYSIDDAGGGICRRFEPPVGGTCTGGGSPEETPLGTWCVIATEFAEFECPAGETERHPQWPTCVAYRTSQGAATCGSEPALLMTTIVPEPGFQYGCFAFVGPQPDTCIGIGQAGDCYEHREPAAAACAAASGCVALVGRALSCDGKTVTIDMTMGASGVGTPGDDVILGTPNADLIDAGAGNDTVCADGGDDTVVGGDGDDTIFGGDGRDIIRGGPGVDTIDGEAGNDRLLGGIDGDTISGGDGNDYIGGFGGPDLIYGGPGNDRIFGGFGPDVINGGAGADNINGLIGDDIIDGQDGDDTVNGDAGNDTVRGGPGNDVVNGGNASDAVFGDGGDDTLGGGKADDTLDGGFGFDVCAGNKHFAGDFAVNCETTYGIP